MASSYHWYVPHWGPRVINETIEPADPSSYGWPVELVLPSGPGADELYEASVRVTRIIGQYCVRLSNVRSVANPIFIHNRIYPVSSDGASYFTRFLSDGEDADSDFLWHQVDQKPKAFYNDTAMASASQFGFDGWTQSWTDTAGGTEVSMETIAAPKDGRYGSFDIRVDRTIHEGEVLLWKTELDDSSAGNMLGDLANDGFSIIVGLWIRLLLKVKI